MISGRNINQIRAEARDIHSFGERVALDKLETAPLDILQLLVDESEHWEYKLEPLFIIKIKALLEQRKLARDESRFHLSQEQYDHMKESDRISKRNALIGIGIGIAGVALAIISFFRK